MRELLATTDAEDLAYWAAYYRIEPWGGQRGDLQAGIVAATIVNTMRQFSGGKGRDTQPDDFALVFGTPVPVMASAEQMAEKLKMFTLKAGGKVS